jgi:hypothetical protein
MPHNSEPYLTTLECDGWEVDDGEQAHIMYPDTFWIPPLSARESVEPEAFVKLRFYFQSLGAESQQEIIGERMWVQVIEKVGPFYRGVLDNDPTSPTDLTAGTEIWFQPRHIIDILPMP